MDHQTTALRALEASVVEARDLIAARRFAGALAVCRRALELAPGNPDLLHSMGIAHAESGNPLLALKHIDLALAQAPNAAVLHSHRGEILRRWGMFDEAVGSCRQAVALNPNDAEAQNNLGVALLDAGRPAEAAEPLRASMRLAPAMREPPFNLGRALRAVRDWRGAAEAQRVATQITPNLLDPWIELCTLYERLDDLQAADQAATRAVALAPQSAEAWYHLGDVATARSEIDRAIVAYRRALALAPQFAAAMYQLCQLLLGRGEFEEGWRLYESRRDPSIPGAIAPPLLAMPEWQGEPLAGMRLLVVTEQGYGDNFQLCRLVPQLAQAGARVTLGMSREVAPALTGLAGVERIVTHIDEIRAFDAERWTLICSLPLRLGLRADAIPAPASYLSADPQKTQRIRERLAAGGTAFNVGIVWAGRPTHGNDWRRSLTVDRLAPLAAIPGVRLVSLQKGDRAADLKRPDAPPGIVPLGDELADFGDTAAALAALDLLVSVDSAPVHLAGALGRPVWTLLPQVPDWRWRLDTDRSRWYPSMRLFRQTAYNDWDGVIARVAAALRETVRATRP
jgi:tetratricopeptide (TPR) repeat protein